MGEKTGSERKGGALFVTAAVLFGGMQRSLGTFPTKEAAIEAREKAEASVKEQLNRLLNGAKG